MPENESTKVCPLCTETIKAAAQVCPYCRRNQGRGWFLSRYDLLAMVTALLFIGALVVTGNFFNTGRSYASSRDKIEVLNSQLMVDVSGEARNVGMTGILTNKSDYAWHDLAFEVRYLDGSGKLLDVDSGSEDFTVLAHTDHSFHLDFASRKSAPEHASYKVIVRSAREPGRWFATN